MQENRILMQWCSGKSSVKLLNEIIAAPEIKIFTEKLPYNTAAR